MPVTNQFYRHLLWEGRMAKSFNEMTAKDDNTVMIVDALNLAFRYKHAKKRHFEEDYLRTVASLAKSYNAGQVIITADGGSSSYRRNILPEYKANRKEKYENQTEAEKQEFEDFMTDYERTLEYISQHWPLLRFDKVEADDIAAYIVSQLKTDNKIWLISSDRDWDLLVDDNVSRFSYVTRKEITADNWGEHYAVPRGNYIDYKCLCGDAGDNVPGIPGVGPKRAAALINMYGTAMDIADLLPIDSRYKYIQSLNDFGAENIMKNYELMDLVAFCEDAIGEANLDKIGDIIN